MNLTSSVNIREVAVPTISSIVLFATAIFLPPLGILFSIFCPIPIVLAYLYSGKKTGLICLISITMIILLFINMHLSLVFFVEYGLVAVVMAESIRRNYSVDKIVVFSVGVSLLLGGTLVYLFLTVKDINLRSFLVEQIRQSVESSINVYRNMGVSNSEIDNINLYSEKLVSAFISSVPAWMVVSSSIGVLLNYILAKKIWNAYFGESSYFENTDFEKWSANEYLIWLLILSGMMLLTPVTSLNTIGLNLLIVSLLIYFYQGIATVLFYMRKKTFPFFLKVIVYGLIITQPLLLLFVILLGVFDTWIDFRKLKYTGNNHNVI